MPIPCPPEMPSCPTQPVPLEPLRSILRRVPPGTLLTNDQVLAGLRDGKYCLIPKRNHRACWGRGYIGRNVKTGETIPCACLRLYEICIPEPETLEKLRERKQIEENMRSNQPPINSSPPTMLDPQPHIKSELDISNEK